MEKQAQGALSVIPELVEIKSCKGRVKHLWCIVNKNLFFNCHGWKYFLEISLDKGEDSKTEEYVLVGWTGGWAMPVENVLLSLSFLILHEEWSRNYKC